MAGSGMARALVFGGGGPVGIAWESGLVAGLAAAGIDLSRADRIVGTSAGSVVGARLALGHDLSDAVERTASATGDRASGSDRPASDGPASDRPGSDRPAVDLAGLMEVMATAAVWEGPAEEARALIGRFALDATTAPEDAFVGFFADLSGEAWPEAFACTAVDAVTGAFVEWSRGSGVDLQRAVASSCSVPGIFPPITIDGVRYIDGGMRSGLNADLVAGAERAVVVSVMPTSMAGFADVGAELAAVRAGGGALELVEPDEAFLELAGMGANLMDAGLSAPAFELGRALADREADRIGALWA